MRGAGQANAFRAAQAALGQYGLIVDPPTLTVDELPRGQVATRSIQLRNPGPVAITATLHAVSPEVTKVLVESDIKLTGKVAQFGRLGVIRDTSEKLMSDFAHNLNTMLDADKDPDDDSVTEAPAATEAAPTAAAAEPEAAPAAAAGPQPTPGVRKINGPAAEPIELSDLGGAPALLKRLLPAFGGLVILLLVLRRLRK